MSLTTVAAVIVGGLLLLGLLALAVFNGLIRARNMVATSWALVDTELQRRHDLVPNLVECVKGYATHERQLFESITNSRATALTAPRTAAAASGPESSLAGGLQQLFAVSEQYPLLKADENFLDLQRQLADAEDRIAVARRVYNANVRDFNTRIQSFPGMIFSGSGRFPQQRFFEIEDTMRLAGPPDATIG